MNHLKRNRLASIYIFAFMIFGKMTTAQESQPESTVKLAKELAQISGIAKDGDNIWAIIDTKNAAVYKMDLSGRIVQQIQLTNYNLKDVEAVTFDSKYLYIGDIGDNNGTRKHRTICRVAKSSLGDQRLVQVNAELITFAFPDEEAVKKKKSNNYDCEAMISFHDSLYVFTKRREDLKTELYALPKNPGTYTARNISLFKSKGMVTDAAVNKQENEVALIGYDAGHTRPFIWILDHFSGDNFFSGDRQRFEITNQKKIDWQVEGITYRDPDSFFISCERTKDVANELYLFKKNALVKVEKGSTE